MAPESKPGTREVSEDSSGNSLWPTELVDSVASAFEDLLTLRARKDLELRVRSGTGTEEKISRDCCAPAPEPVSGEKSGAAKGRGAAEGHEVGRLSDGSTASSATCSSEAQGACAVEGHSCGDSGCHAKKLLSSELEATAPAKHFHFKKDPHDTLGELLEDWTSRRRLRELVVTVTERSASVYAAALQRGQKDGLAMPTAEEAAQLRRDVATEALLRTIQLTIFQEVRKRCMSDSHEGGLLANPSGYRGGHLDYLQPETIRGLMVDGYGLQSSFVGDKLRSNILCELELLEFDGAFSEVLSQNSGVVRSDSMCWKTLEELDREKQPGLCHLFKSMSALPFELNKKANLCLQASWTFQLACYSEKNSFYAKHMDGGFDADADNGRKITCIYYPNSPTWDSTRDGGSLRLYKGESYKQFLERKERDGADNETKETFGKTHRSPVGYFDEVLADVAPKGDFLVIFRSRQIPHEVLAAHRKRFAVSLWISGPAGPGDF